MLSTLVQEFSDTEGDAADSMIPLEVIDELSMQERKHPSDRESYRRLIHELLRGYHDEKAETWAGALTALYDEKNT